MTCFVKVMEYYASTMNYEKLFLDNETAEKLL